MMKYLSAYLCTALLGLTAQLTAASSERVALVEEQIEEIGKVAESFQNGEHLDVERLMLLPKDLSRPELRQLLSVKSKCEDSGSCSDVLTSFLDIASVLTQKRSDVESNTRALEQLRVNRPHTKWIFSNLIALRLFAHSEKEIVPMFMVFADHWIVNFDSFPQKENILQASLLAFVGYDMSSDLKHIYANTLRRAIKKDLPTEKYDHFNFMLRTGELILTERTHSLSELLSLSLVALRTRDEFVQNFRFLKELRVTGIVEWRYVSGVYINKMFDEALEISLYERLNFTADILGRAVKEHEIRVLFDYVLETLEQTPESVTRNAVAAGMLFSLGNDVFLGYYPKLLQLIDFWALDQADFQAVLELAILVTGKQRPQMWQKWLEQGELKVGVAATKRQKVQILKYKVQLQRVLGKVVRADVLALYELTKDRQVLRDALHVIVRHDGDPSIGLELSDLILSAERDEEVLKIRESLLERQAVN